MLFTQAALNFPQCLPCLSFGSSSLLPPNLVTFLFAFSLDFFLLHEPFSCTHLLSHHCLVSCSQWGFPTCLGLRSLICRSGARQNFRKSPSEYSLKTIALEMQSHPSLTEQTVKKPPAPGHAVGTWQSPGLLLLPHPVSTTNTPDPTTSATIRCDVRLPCLVVGTHTCLKTTAVLLRSCLPPPGDRETDLCGEICCGRPSPSSLGVIGLWDQPESLPSLPGSTFSWSERPTRLLSPATPCPSADLVNSLH